MLQQSEVSSTCNMYNHVDLYTIAHVCHHFVSKYVLMFHLQRQHLRPSRSEAIGSDSVFINGMGRINERHCDIKARREKPLADSDRLPVF